MDINPEEKIVKYFRSKLIKWEKENFVDFPWRKSKNEWYSLAVEIMLQRTRAEQVLPVYLVFCNKYKTPEDYYNDEFANIFESLGLQQRNKEFKQLAKILSTQEIPEEKEILLKLPGVGEYVASAYRSLHLNKRDVIIDSNVVRLLSRFFGFDAHGETRRQKWFIKLANTLTPQRNFYFYNYALIDFPRAICKTRALCKKCVFKNKCAYYLNKLYI
jgi:A/G-specific adenine glycosylase